jgi:hypothetical protein
MRFVFGLLLAAPLIAQTLDDARAILRRVSEEASVFARTAPNLVTEETLVQLSLRKKKRFRPRIGAAALRPPDVEYQTREIVSEYAYGSFRDSSGLHEFRQVISVDGRKVQSQESARRTLVMGIRSRDDAALRELLKDFESHGLYGAATDFGQVLLLFTRDKLANYAFAAGGRKLLGADPVIVIQFRSLPGKGSLVVFDDKQAHYLEMSGELWVRAADYVPLRVTLRSPRTQDGTVLLTEASVDYAPSAQSVVTPVSALHREIVANVVTMENQFRYKPFQRFGSESDLKFDVDPK